MIRRVSFLCLLLTLTLSHLKGQIRDTIDIQFNDESLEIILDSISAKSGYFFSYNANIMPHGSLFTLKHEQVYIDDLLKSLFIGTHLEFTKIEDQIILRKVLRDSEGNKKVYTNISGWVKDDETGGPVFGAHVYINRSTIGAYTDSKGNYELNGLKPGNYQVIFSHIGYAPSAFEINSADPSNYVINASMKTATNLLKGIEVSSKPLVSEDDWIHYYKSFSEEFIGSSTNANRCTFLNPDILEFSYSDSLGTYEAVVKEPLIMENKGLGYQVMFEIDYFTSGPKTTEFHVRASFKELEPENHRTKKRWKKNRERSYYGSTFHFLKTLLNDNLRSEGYHIYLTEDVNDPNHNREVSQKDDIILTDSLGRTYLNFEGYMIVEYRKEFRNTSYQGSIQEDQRLKGFEVTNVMGPATNQYQVSSMTLLKPKIRLLKNSQLTEPEEVRFYGYWSWERMSELMPIDYNPKTDN